jgi:predicted dehydrogenase
MPVSRRDFLHRAAAGAVAGASVAAAPVLGAEPAVAAGPARAVPPSGKVRVAVIGVNGQGRAHVKELRKLPDVDLVAVCDADPGAFIRLCEQQFKNDLHAPEYVQDVRRLLDRQDIDAVTIATPNHWHAVMSVWAMQSGKDVYVEKPCSHNVVEGRVMTQWARKLGRMCQMGVQSRSTTGMRQLLEFIRGGKLGRITAARAICFRPRPSIGLVDAPAPVPPGMDFDLWAGPAPAEVPVRQKLHYDWHWNHLTGNGDLGNQNPHELDKARWGLGKQELPRRVVSLGGRLGYVDNGDVANSQVTIFQWDDAVLISDVRGLPVKAPVTYGLPLAGGFKGPCNVWYGTEGFAVAEGYSGGAAYDLEGNPLGKWQGGDYAQHFANFIGAVKSRDHRDLHLDVEDGHLSSALAHLGNVSWALGEAVPAGTRASLAADDPRVQATWESFEAHLAEHPIDFSVTRLTLGRELTIDPQTETTSDPQATPLFTREYRKGYELPRV